MRPRPGRPGRDAGGRDPGGPAAPEGAELAVLPGLEPHRGGLPAAGAGDAVPGQAAGRQQTAQQAADDVRELPRNASPGPAWRRCHLPGARPGRRRARRPGRRPANRQAALCPVSVPARLRARAARGCLRWPGSQPGSLHKGRTAGQRRLLLPARGGRCGPASELNTTGVRERANAQGTEVKDRGRNPPGRPPSSKRRPASKRAAQPRYQQPPAGHVRTQHARDRRRRAGRADRAQNVADALTETRFCRCERVLAMRSYLLNDMIIQRSIDRFIIPHGLRLGIIMSCGKLVRVTGAGRPAGRSARG